MNLRLLKFILFLPLFVACQVGSEILPPDSGDNGKVSDFDAMVCDAINERTVRRNLFRESSSMIPALLAILSSNEYLLIICNCTSVTSIVRVPDAFALIFISVSF